MKKTRKMPANMWAPHEQLVLYDAVTQGKVSGRTITESFKQAASDVNRTASAAGWQWYSILVPKIKAGDFKPEKVRSELAKKEARAAAKAPVLQVEVRTKRKYTRRVETANHVSVAGQTTRKQAAPVQLEMKFEKADVDFESMSYREIITMANRQNKRITVLETKLPKVEAALNDALDVIKQLQQA